MVNQNNELWLKQTCKYARKRGVWVQNPIARFCESLFSLVHYRKPLVKGKINNSGYYCKPKRKLNTSSYHVIVTSITYHGHNMNGYFPKPKKHINTSCSQQE